MDFTKIFLDGMIGCIEFEEALSIVKANSFENVWLIGGSVYRTIASQLYGISKPDMDFDFIIERPISVKDFNLPEKWTVSANRFGNPKLIGPTQNIDFVPLKNVYSIKHRHLKPSIDAYLIGVPLTVQSIVFDVRKNIIIGNIGIRALEMKLVEVNDIHYAKYASAKKGTLLREYISKYARELDFIPVYPNEA
jgi:hypothetical protein